MKNSMQAETVSGDFPKAPDTLRSMLIVGAESTIGRGLLDSFESSGVSVWSTTRRREDTGPRRLLVNLSQAPETWQFPETPMDVAFLCAAVTSQAECANEPEAAYAVNVLQTVALAKKLTEAGTFVVFISTNLVLDGDTAYAAVGQPVNPQTIYGRHKAEAEQRLLALGARIAIVRFGKVIAPGLPLFKEWADNLRAGKMIHPFSDMVMAPIALSFAVEVLRRVAMMRLSGVVQASAADDLTFAEAARLIARHVRADPGLVAPRARPAEGPFSPSHSTLDAAGLTALGLLAPPPEAAFDYFSPTGVTH
jgi:dTDP-4-dehydrorhamnose reductase